MTKLVPTPSSPGLFAAPALAVLLLAAPLSALAFDSGGSQSTKSCPKGQVWSDEAKKCVVEKSAFDCPQGMAWSDTRGRCLSLASGGFSDEELVNEGRLLARGGHYEKAIATLSAVARQDDPLALTYLGYSHRKLGHFDLAMRYYVLALAADPDNVDTREYLGEGYIAIGRADLARAQLAEIEARCGTSCEQYRTLHALVAPSASEGFRGGGG
jgi:tetratricopeptide (TPR) repeat protein